jgi:hypothetical protein
MTFFSEEFRVQVRKKDIFEPTVKNEYNNNNNNSIQFFIIYVPSQQLQGQLRTRHSANTIIIIIIIIQFNSIQIYLRAET